MVVTSSIGIAMYDTRKGLMTSARKVWQVNVSGGLYSSPAVVGRRDGGMVIFVTADNQK
jgi:hypothetical protein